VVTAGAANRFASHADRVLDGGGRDVGPISYRWKRALIFPKVKEYRCMNAIGCDVGSPFLAGPDSDMAEQHRPPVDDETMRRLRTPFEADPFDAPKRRRVEVFDNDGDPRGERRSQPAPPRGSDAGRSRG